MCFIAMACDDSESIKIASGVVKQNFPEYKLIFAEWDNDESDDKLRRAIDK